MKYQAPTVNTVIDAAGDLLYGTAADTVGRLAIGTAGQVLKVNSGATAPEWGAASGGSTFAGVSVYNSTNQTISNTTETAINFNTEKFDTDAFHNNSVNNTRLTVPVGKAGYYHIIGFVASASGTGQRYILIRKNGNAENYVGYTATAGEGGTTAAVIYNLAEGDYVEMFVYQASGGNLTYYTGINYGTFAMNWLGA